MDCKEKNVHLTEITNYLNPFKLTRDRNLPSYKDLQVTHINKKNYVLSHRKWTFMANNVDFDV